MDYVQIAALDNGGVPQLRVALAQVNPTVGDITGNARVDGGILVHKPDSNSWFHFGIDHTPVVTIGPGATVNGTLKFEREVKLYVSDKAHVGQIVGATPVKFTGDQPPQQSIARHPRPWMAVNGSPARRLLRQRLL